eukprot:996151_1
MPVQLSSANFEAHIIVGWCRQMLNQTHIVSGLIGTIAYFTGKSLRAKYLGWCTDERTQLIHYISYNRIRIQTPKTTEISDNSTIGFILGDIQNVQNDAEKMGSTRNNYFKCSHLGAGISNPRYYNRFNVYGFEFNQHSPYILDIREYSFRLWEDYGHVKLDNDHCFSSGDHFKFEISFHITDTSSPKCIVRVYHSSDGNFYKSLTRWTLSHPDLNQMFVVTPAVSNYNFCAGFEIHSVINECVERRNTN